jgi:hypothetical protein
MKNSVERKTKQPDRAPESTKPPFETPVNRDFVGNEANGLLGRVCR